MRNYENAKIELLDLLDTDIISTSYPLSSEGTETPILPNNGTAGASVGDDHGVSSNY